MKQKLKNMNVRVCSEHIPTTGKESSHSYNIYVDSTEGKNKVFNVSTDGILIEDEDDFYNKENFILGIKYITEMASEKVMEGCLSLLDEMTEYKEELEDSMSTYISFFCEVGVWENIQVRQSNIYDEDFTNYLKNCMSVWFGDLHNEWIR